jgi:urease accessory protein
MARDLAQAATTPAQQRRLLQIWFSPSFPVGAYAYSHGLERAVEAGSVMDRASLAGWIADLVAHGSIGNDLVLVAATWRAIAVSDVKVLHETAELAAALYPSAERKLESVTQGGSFLDAIDAAWPTDTIHRLRTSWPGEVAYPVAVGVAAAGHGVALDALLEAYAVAFVGNLASAAIRLGVIGQTDAQRLQPELMTTIDAAVTTAATSTLADLGSATWSADLCSMEHETQYTRLFRS